MSGPSAVAEPHPRPEESAEVTSQATHVAPAASAEPQPGADGEMKDCAPGCGENDRPAAVVEGSADPGIVLAPLRLSVPSKAIGVCWFLLAYLFLSHGLLANCLLVSCIGTWCGWEVYWRRIWRKQEVEAKHQIMELAAAEKVLKDGQTLDTEALRRLHVLSWEICRSTTQTPMRCVVESFVVMCCLWLLYSWAASWLLCLFLLVGTDLLGEGFSLRSEAHAWWAEEGQALFENQPPHVDDAHLYFPTMLLVEELELEMWALGLEAMQGALSLALSIFLWYILQSAVKRRLQHRVLLARLGSVNVVVRCLEAGDEVAGATGRGEADEQREDNDARGGAGGEDPAGEEGENGGMRGEARAEEEEEARERGVEHTAATTLAHIAATADAANEGVVREDVVERLLAYLASSRPRGDLAKETVSAALQELLAGRDPTAVLVAVVRSLASKDAEMRLSTLQSFAAILPKQCSCRVRHAISKTGLIGSLVCVLWRPPARTAGGRQGARRGGEGGEGGADGGETGQRGEGGGARDEGGEEDGGQEREAARAREEAACKKGEVLAGNLLVRLATQMEWETDKAPLFDEVSGRLCSAILDDPTGIAAERSCVLLAVLANTLANTLAYMRLYEAAAENMPLRLEQVRLDLRRMSSEMMLQRTSASLLHAKSMHFLHLAVPPLSALLLSEATDTAKAAASLCVALLGSQRPDVRLPPAVLESVVGMLGETRSWTAVYAAEALGALCVVPSLEKRYDEQGVVELVVHLARRGEGEAKTSAATVIATLAKRGRAAREHLKRAGAVEILRDMEGGGQASMREAAGAALAALSLSLGEDLLARCSSSAYFCLVLFCFSVQLGGVHAVMDVIEVVSDILHVLWRITSLRLRTHEPSAVAVVTDFLVHDPVDFLLLVLLVMAVPGLILILCLRQRMARPDLVDVPRIARHRFMTHRSWLLGITLKQTEESAAASSSASAPTAYKYTVVDVQAEGPAHHCMQHGDELLEVDGCDVSTVDLTTLVEVLRGRPRLSLAQRIGDKLVWALGREGVVRQGRGSRASLTVLRTKKNGRKARKTVWVKRGAWFGEAEEERQGEEGEAASGEAAAGRGGRGEADKSGGRGGERSSAGEEAAGTEGGGAREPEDERVCRICQCTEEEAPEQGKLFSPCHCRGTMRYIHEGCLDTWRRMSANAASNFQCDQCFFTYRVQRRGVASFVRRTGVVETAALLIFTIVVFFTGFLVKWARVTLEAPVPFDTAPVSSEAEALEELYTIDWHHMVSGCIGVGIIGFSTLVILLPMRGFGFIGYHPNLFRGSQRRDSSATVVLCIVVVAGMVRALFLAYKLTNWLAGVIAERSGTRILPADESVRSSSSVSARSRMRQLAGGALRWAD